MAKHIVAELVDPENLPHSYFEPFCGSAAVFFAMPQCRLEMLSDLHGGVICLARTLADPELGPELFRRAELVLNCEVALRDSIRTLQDSSQGWEPGEKSLEYALAFLVASWQARNGKAGTTDIPQSFALRYTQPGGTAAGRWQSVVASLPEWHQRLRNATIVCRDAFDLIPKIPDEHGVAVYIDPPYVEKSDQYLHDLPSPQTHFDLAVALGRFKKTRVVVSYYDHPMIRDFYLGWRFKAVAMNKGMAQASKGRGKTGATQAAEVLIVNGPEFETPDLENKK